MKANYHTHSKWCDGAATPREMAEEAVRRGFDVLGFSSHAMLPGDPLAWPLTKERLRAYAAEIRALREEFAPRLEILCGVEADYVPGIAEPSREIYSAAELESGIDYIIGSVHFVAVAGGEMMEADLSPEALTAGIEQHFGGDARAFIKAYFAQEREMVSAFDFDIVGHPDLVRKFNARLGYFDEAADWYNQELEKTADAIAASGKIVEINTGAISRGWMQDAYPSERFRAMLARRGVKFILSSDAHSPQALDCAFERYAKLAPMASDGVTSIWRARAGATARR